MNIVVDLTVETITIIDSDVYGADVFVQINGLEPRCLGQITQRNGRLNFRQTSLLTFSIPTDFSSNSLPLIFTAALFSRRYVGQINLTPGIEQAKNGIPSIVSTTAQLRKPEGRIGCEMAVKYCLDFVNSVTQNFAPISLKSTNLNYSDEVRKEIESRNATQILYRPKVSITLIDEETMSEVFKSESGNGERDNESDISNSSFLSNSQTITDTKPAENNQKKEEDSQLSNAKQNNNEHLSSDSKKEQKQNSQITQQNENVEMIPKSPIPQRKSSQPTISNPTENQTQNQMGLKNEIVSRIIITSDKDANKKTPQSELPKLNISSASPSIRKTSSQNNDLQANASKSPSNNPTLQRSQSDLEKTRFKADDEFNSFKFSHSPKNSARDNYNEQQPLLSQSVRQGIQWKKGNKPESFNKEASNSSTLQNSGNSAIIRDKEMNSDSLKKAQAAPQTQPRVEFSIPEKHVETDSDTDYSDEFF